MVPKRREKPEIVAYGLMTRALRALERHGTPIDPTVEHAIDPAVATRMQQRLPFPPEMRDKVDDLHSLGPSATYRWWDGPHHSAISLGTLEDDPPSPFIPDGFSQFTSPNRDGRTIVCAHPLSLSLLSLLSSSLVSSKPALLPLCFSTPRPHKGTGSKGNPPQSHHPDHATQTVMPIRGTERYLSLSSRA